MTSKTRIPEGFGFYGSPPSYPIDPPDTWEHDESMWLAWQELAALYDVEIPRQYRVRPPRRKDW